MVYLALTILLTSLFVIFFKVFPRYNINSLQAIVVNYWTCVITGCFFLGRFPLNAEGFQQPWLPWAIGLGCGFFSIFNLLAYCTRVDGITTATIANKLSLVIPVLFSFVLYHEDAGILKIAGIILAIPAVYLTSKVTGEVNKTRNLFWIIVLFIGSGLLDTTVKYVEQAYLDTAEKQTVFPIYVFFAASTLGAITLAVLVLLKKIKLQARNIVAGILLGIPNYFSIYYLILLLHSGFLQSSAAIPVANIGIMLVSALAALVLFKEKATAYRIAGLLLSLIAILLITFADLHGRGV